MKINENYLNLKDSYLFATVGRKTAAYKAAHPEKDVIRLSIGRSEEHTSELQSRI